MAMDALLKQKTYAVFKGGNGPKSLPGLCLELLSEQKRSWQDLREGYEALKTVKERNLPCRGFSVRIQHNPGRIRSSLADAGQKNRNERLCFLCMDRLPEDQKGILYRGNYLILCNPMPIFPFHFTVSHLDHHRQAIQEHLATLLHLMVDLGSGWAVLYNGPRCGASAPDHLHFQIVPSGRMPVEKGIRDEKRLDLITQVDGAFFYLLRDLGRAVILLEGEDPIPVGKGFRNFLNALKKVLFIDEEPMMNLAAYYEEKKWRLVIFPRQKHRPDAFFREGDGRLVVSPGAIDMAGVLVTPVKKDFERMDSTTVMGIYGEVSLKEKAVERALEAMEHLKSLSPP
jgi:hypothetical protein